MTNLLSRLKITLQIGLIGGLGVAALLGLSAVDQMADARKEASLAVMRGQVDLNENLSLLQTKLLDARRAEKDFQLRRDKTYADRNVALIAEVDRVMGIILADSDAVAIAPKIAAAQQELAGYSAAFATLVAAETTIGLDENSGLQGALRTSVRSAEQLLNAASESPLVIGQLMLRRHEKDFLARRAPQYVDDFKKRYTEFTAALDRSEMAGKADIAAKMAAYQRDFLALSDAALGLAGQQKLLSESYARIEPVLSDAYRQGGEAKRAAEASFEATSHQITQIRWVTLGTITIALAVLCLLMGRSISGPITKLALVLHQMTKGNLQVLVPARERRDEIGQIAEAVEVFRGNGLEMRRMQEEKLAADQNAIVEKKRHQDRLASSFETSVGGIVGDVTGQATDMRVAAQGMAGVADQTRNRALAAAAASDQTSANVQTIATAAQELSASINEISRQVNESTRIAGEATDQARQTNARVASLAESADRIGAVVQLIQAIASQTNLLALNATIEAARAGEMGKGFAVVASEVKNLANQTSKATEEISAQVAAVQGATQEAVADIRAIATVVERVGEIAAGVAAAVEEQGAATAEIARNVQQAAIGTEEVATNIAAVTEAAVEARQTAASVEGTAQKMQDQACALNGQVNAFLLGLKAS
jgi:methyl-accepting chemotaxis protein